MSNNELKEIITVQDLVEYLMTYFDPSEKVVKSDMLGTGYTRFRRTEKTRFHVAVNPDPRDDAEFIDPIIGKTYSQGETFEAVIL